MFWPPAVVTEHLQTPLMSRIKAFLWKYSQITMIGMKLMWRWWNSTAHWMIIIRSVLTCLSRCVSTNQVAANATKPVRLEKGRVRLSYSAELYREREREQKVQSHTQARTVTSWAPRTRKTGTSVCFCPCLCCAFLYFRHTHSTSKARTYLGGHFSAPHDLNGLFDGKYLVWGWG